MLEKRTTCADAFAVASITSKITRARIMLDIMVSPGTTRAKATAAFR
jgi:hypothetical protein